MVGNINIIADMRNNSRRLGLRSSPLNAIKARLIYRGPNALRFSVSGFSVIATNSRSKITTHTRLKYHFDRPSLLSFMIISALAEGINNRNLFIISKTGEPDSGAL
jgi:hypothetical protein